MEPSNEHGHIPVMLPEVLEHLRPQAGDVMLDCTCGLGGHSEAMLQAGAAVCGVDRDQAARERAAQRLAGFGDLFSSYPATFADAAEQLVEQGKNFDGILADLGVSSLQLDDITRGFSIRSEDPADMRMGDGCGQDAISLIATSSQNELKEGLRRFGEVAQAGRIARALQTAVAAGRCSGAELAEAVRKVVRGRFQRHPAIPVFQALRIMVNDELGQLDRLLLALPKLLQPGGRVAIITFHSLEDRMVKRAFRMYLQDDVFSELSRRPVLPSETECSHNRRAASAKLRWAVRR